MPCVARLIALTFLILLSSAANTSVISDLWGVVVDPLKLESAGNSANTAVDKATQSLTLLQNELDQDIRDYLAEFSLLIDKLDDAVARQRQDLIDQVVTEINKFTIKVDNLITKAIVEAECAVEVTLTDTIRRALGGNVRFLTRNTLKIELPFTKPGNWWQALLGRKQTADLIEIDLSRSQSPYAIYEQIRDEHLANLNYANSESDAIKLVNTYAEIARFARLAHCHYRNDAYGSRLTREYKHFNLMVVPWTNVINIRVGEKTKHN